MLLLVLVAVFGFLGLAGSYRIVPPTTVPARHLQFPDKSWKKLNFSTRSTIAFEKSGKTFDRLSSLFVLSSQIPHSQKLKSQTETFSLFPRPFANIIVAPTRLNASAI